MAEIKTAKLSDLIQDPENANRGTPHGNDLLKKSLREGLAGRSLLASADLTVLAGNKTLAAAQELGMKEAVFVETEGDALIVHVRKDIPNSKTKVARRLALGDNKIAELNYNPDDEILGSLARFDKSILEDFWSEEEIRQKMAFVDDIKFKEYDESVANDVEMIKCPHCGQSFPK